MDRTSAMETRFGRDLTTGSIPRHLLRFSIPMLVGNMLQSGYSIINMIWVGNIVGEGGLGATAVSFPIMFILIGIAAGVSMATAVLVAQFYGAKNYERMRLVIDNSLYMQIVLSVFLITGGIACSNWLLRLMDTPVEIFSMATSTRTDQVLEDLGNPSFLQSRSAFTCSFCSYHFISLSPPCRSQ